MNLHKWHIVLLIDEYSSVFYRLFMNVSQAKSPLESSQRAIDASGE
jgi:hypothetical protein